MSRRARQKESAGLLMYRHRDGDLEVLLAHPGGPYWTTRDDGAWTIPKGGINPEETPFESAVREFREETGFEPTGPYDPIGHVTQRSGKIVYAWAFRGDCDPRTLTSITTQLEWPPRSGHRIEIPEIDRADFFTLENARRAINVAQQEFLDRLLTVIGAS